MTDFLIETIDLTDFSVAPDEAIELTPTHIDRALSLSRAATPAQRWQTYLNALADLGFEQWLNLRVPEMAVRKLASGLWQINGFRVRSIAAPEEDEILVAQPLIQPGSAAHLYVAVGVQEETAQVTLTGSIRFDQLATQTWPIADDAYRIGVNQLDLGSNQFLLTLRCADPATIALPATANLSDRLMQVQQQVSRSVINVGQWLNHQLDSVAEELSWVLMPSLSAQTAMRSRSTASTPETTLSQILQTISGQGILLPTETQSAYQDLTITEPGLRVYATIGAMDAGEWSLLIILGTQSGEALPANLQLSLSDGKQVLFEQMVEVARSQSYIYAQVIGAVDECFQATITLPNGIAHTLPEFVFQV